MSYTLPPVANNAKGDQRKVGIELEFAGVEIEQAAELIQSLYGGEIKREHRYLLEITNTDLGNFQVELDARILQKMASEDVFKSLGFRVDEASIQKPIEDVFDKLAKAVVPLEIVMPPVPISVLHRMEELREALQKNRAKGTSTSLVHAFGMHINIECPDIEITTLLTYMRSFLILYPWLIQVLEIDISRRISPFVDPFPPRYVQKVLDPLYGPDQSQFIDDYVAFNPTRNRPVDLMPVFGMLNPELIQAAMEGKKNDPRPTFHYRLPNSHIDNSQWRFEQEWNRWLAIEKLVQNKEMVNKLSRLYLLRQNETMISFNKEWANTVSIMLDLDE